MKDTGEHLYSLLKTFDTAMLITGAADGTMHGRPMALAHLSPGSDAFFVTSLQSPKIAEIEQNPAVLVTFQDGGQYATVSGKARVVRDQHLIDTYWKEAWKVWFPKGKTDPDICMIAVLADEGEYWDNAGVQGLKYAFEAVKAYVKGETPKVDEDAHAKVKL